MGTFSTECTYLKDGRAQRAETCISLYQLSFHPITKFTSHSMVKNTIVAPYKKADREKG